MKAVVFLLAALTVPAHAGIVNFDVQGLLGPLLSGSDPLKLAGQDFMASGAFSQDLTAIGTTGDSATYSLPGTLQITVGALTLTGYNANLTITDPASGPGTVSLGFSVIQAEFNPDVFATLSLPEGALQGAAIQDFSASLSGPASSLTYDVIGTSQVLSGELGISGSASIAGAGGAGVPEPGTIGLLAAGLGLMGCVGLKFRGIRG